MAPPIRTPEVIEIPNNCENHSNASHLAHDVGHADENCANHCHHSRGIGIKAVAHEVGYGGFAELSQVGNHQGGQQYEAPGPSHDEFRGSVSCCGNPSGHRDERCGRHPIRGGGHPVGKGGHASACNIVFLGGCGSGTNRDEDVYPKGDSDEDEIPSRLVHQSSSSSAKPCSLSNLFMKKE